jgi:hypothetical protein
LLSGLNQIAKNEADKTNLTMTKREIPTPEVFASCPNSGPILEYYLGHFEAVFVLLSPFFKPTRCDDKRVEEDDWGDKHQQVAECDPVSWQQVLALTNLKNIAQIDVGLRTTIGGLNKSHANETFSVQLKPLAEQGVFLPDEGEVSPFLENRLLKAIQQLGHNWLWLGDELATERKLYWIEDLMVKELFYRPGNVFTHDHSILLTTHWDSHCSFLCADKPTIERILAFDYFEGFYCTEETQVYWGLY